MILDIGHALAVLAPKKRWRVIEGTLHWEDESPQPSEEQIQAKLAELQADYEAKQYQRDRLQEYPSIQELVVALYDEEDKQAIIEKRNAVKAKYPKPE
tara:strand:- start:86 stop:379 length:294 start_codon:yes stop_codon:yes gene_type:complete